MMLMRLMATSCLMLILALLFTFSITANTAGGLAHTSYLKKGSSLSLLIVLLISYNHRMAPSRLVSTLFPLLHSPYPSGLPLQLIEPLLGVQIPTTLCMGVDQRSG
jgi:hypothetical protein